jgi:hypothetical protein
LIECCPTTAHALWDERGDEPETACKPELDRAALILRLLTRVGGSIERRADAVIWFYERRGEHLRCEINQQIEGDRFALIVTLPDGTERVETFEDSGTLNRRSVELEKMLREKGWNGPFARDI